MAKGDNLKRDNLPTMMQIQYLVELEKLGNKRGNVAIIAEICGVTHSSVSKYLKSSYENGYLTKDYRFTPAGKVWLDRYKKMIEDLQIYFRNIGMAEREIPEQVKRMIENMDFHVLAHMVNNDQKMRKDHLADKKKVLSQNMLEEVLQYGNHFVEFTLYRLDYREGTGLSMANRGFERPAVLKHNKRGSWLQLTIKEMKAQSRIDGKPMEGCLQSLKYEKDGLLHLAEIKDNTLRIPLEACRFNKKQGGEVSGIIPITVTCSVGRAHMPESTAVLVFWI